jgi:transcriptional regulator with XRE-family HTH domain
MSKRRRNPRLIFNLPAIRKERGLTLDALSDLTRVPRSTLGDLETGRNAMPSDDNMIALCDGLKVTPGQLFDVAKTPSEINPYKTD